MGNRTPQSKSFNTVKHSNRDTRIKKQQKQRLLILAMAAVIALLLVMLLILSICTIAQKIKNVVDSNNPDIQGVGTTLEEGIGMTVLSEHYKTKGPLLIVNSLGQSNSYIPDESLMTVIAKGAQPTFNGAPVYKLSKDLKIHPDALEAFNAMMTEYCKILWSGEDTVGTSPVELKTAYRSLTEQEYMAACESLTAEEFYRGAQTYQEKFVTMDLTVTRVSIDSEGYYNREEYTTYYECLDRETGILILVRDCRRGDGIVNFRAGDMIRVYGEGAGQKEFYPLSSEAMVPTVGICIHTAYASLIG